MVICNIYVSIILICIYLDYILLKSLLPGYSIFKGKHPYRYMGIHMYIIIIYIYVYMYTTLNDDYYLLFKYLFIFIIYLIHAYRY